MVTYYYFKPSGKYYTEESGKEITWRHTTHDDLFKLNGKMPGLAGDGKEFAVVVIGQCVPRLFPAEKSWK